MGTKWRKSGIRTGSFILALFLLTALLALFGAPSDVQAASVPNPSPVASDPAASSVGPAATSAQVPTTESSAASTTQAPTTQTTAAPTPTPVVTYPQALVIEHSAPSAIAIETSRGRVLYAKESRARLDIPAASKIMTALIAVEKQALDARVTISNAVAEAAYFETTGDNVRLRTGDKFSLEYLLLRLLFYDSDAAALAIAESVANEETEFVKQMNARANALGLRNTLYTTATGLPAQAGASGTTGTTGTTGTGNAATPRPTASAGQNNTAGAAAYTTVGDLASLMQRALQNERFSRLFRKQSEYIVIDGTNLVPMANQISRLWPYSEGRVNGSFLSGLESATTITTGNVNGFGIVCITANGNRDRVVEDTLALMDACQRTYEVALLVQAGQAYTGAEEKTVDGETFGLVYQQTINYVRPIGDWYLKSTVSYKSFGPYSRPIQSSMTVGQVLFELNDGTQISVDVGPDRQILSSINMLDRLLNSLQANRNLYYLLVSSLGLLLLILLGNLVVLAIRYYDRRRR